MGNALITTLTTHPAPGFAMGSAKTLPNLVADIAQFDQYPSIAMAYVSHGTKLLFTGVAKTALMPRLLAMGFVLILQKKTAMNLYHSIGHFSAANMKLNDILGPLTAMEFVKM
jgi:hypothetical protein